VPNVQIDGNELTNWATFHDVFETIFGFPAFYGRNMNA
jgi:RNAse (barnase) inhibitor barstar